MKYAPIIHTAVATMSVVLLSGVASVLAASVDVSSGNHLTGPDSLNTNDTTVNTDPSISIDNWSHADNDLWFTLDGGGNTLDNNTSVAGFSSGDMMLGGTFSTVLNDSRPDLGMLGASHVSSDFGNNTTGPSSLNSNDLTVNNEASVTIDNHAHINNDIGLRVNTGDNTITSNTTVGNVTLGGADISLNVANKANDGASDIVLPPLAPTSVSVMGGNSITGPNSSNTNTTTVNDNASVNIDNSAHIDNNVHLSADTGGNDVSSNTTVGNVKTGAVKVNLNFTNTAN